MFRPWNTECLTYSLYSHVRCSCVDLWCVWQLRKSFPFHFFVCRGHSLTCHCLLAAIKNLVSLICEFHFVFAISIWYNFLRLSALRYSIICFFLRSNELLEMAGHLKQRGTWQKMEKFLNGKTKNKTNEKKDCWVVERLNDRIAYTVVLRATHCSAFRIYESNNEANTNIPYRCNVYCLLHSGCVSIQCKAIAECVAMERKATINPFIDRWSITNCQNIHPKKV